MMNTNLQPKELELYLAVDALLLYEWDPIGISTFEGAKDEYHFYLPHVFKMVMDQTNAEEIAKYLDMVVTERMELPSDFQQQMEIAKKALVLREQIGI